MSPRNLKALVLAGGTGTRLRPLTYTTAKQLVPVANKPILWYALDSLVSAGIRDIGIIISPETGAAIEESVSRWKTADIKTTFIWQAQPLGLAHAVKTAQPYLQDSAFVMYLGDNLIQSELLPMVENFRNSPADAHILLKAVENPKAFGVAELNAQGQVVRLEEKPPNPQSDLALVGVYFFTPEVFEAIGKISPSARGELEITDALQMMITMGKVIESHIIQGWWLDTGKKDDLLQANRSVLDAFCTSNIQAQVDTQSQIKGCVEIGTGTLVKNSQITGPVRIDKNCLIENAVIGPYTSIAQGSKIIGTQIENSVLLENCTLDHIPGRLDHSLMGQGCVLSKSPGTSHRFMLGDHAIVEIA